MSYSAMIPLRNRESFFRDPFFSDCWDVMDRRRRDWEREVNHHSRRFMSDFDDLDRGFGRNSFGKLWGRDRGYDLLEKNDLLNSSATSEKEANGFGLQSDKDNFKVLLDVQQFSPEELTVKTCDNSILIEGKHEEKKDPHGFVSRHFTRKYTVPSDVKVEEVQCNLSSDGVLHVTAPRLNPAITNKTTTTNSSTEKRRSAERETASASSTAKEYPEQRRATPEKETRRSSEREELNSSASSRYSSATGKSDLNEFGRLRDSDRLSSRLFDSYYAGFPDFDLVPFWRRRDWSGGQGEIIDRLSDHKTNIGVLSDRDNFKVQLDVQQFTPEELSVKTVDNVLVVEGKHEDKKDSLGYVSRHFTRKYDIPSDVKAEDVKCSFSSDGLLIVTAPRQRPALHAHEKVSVIPISVQHQSSSSRSVEHKKETSRISEQNGKEKEHVIRMEKQDSSSTAPITNSNGVHIEEQISRSSSNQDAHKEMNKTEGIVKHPVEREHIIPITSA